MSRPPSADSSPGLGPDRPNFLFITTDQQRWDALGCAGQAPIETPHLDRLAASGMRFTRAYPSNPICMPARATWITGRSQRGHHVFEHEVNLNEAIPVIGDALDDAGYRTALIGKAHFKTQALEDDLVPGNGAAWHGPYYGFRHVDLYSGHGRPHGHWRRWLAEHHPEGLELWRPENARTPPTGAFQCWTSALPAEWHHTRWTVDRATDWLADNHRDPFFLWVSFADPHHPFCPPEPYASRYDPDSLPDPIPPPADYSDRPAPYRWLAERERFYRGSLDVADAGHGRHAREMKARYYAMVTFVDEQVGRLLDELERLGVAENTHVIFTSDHGEGLMDHGVFGKPPLAWEEILRVPMIWRHPTIEEGTTCEGVMTHLDLVPTILDLAGAEALPGMEGRSLRSTLAGDERNHRDAVLVERIALAHGSGDPAIRYKMLITNRWKLVHYGTTDGELYDMASDPDQQRNLWEAPAYAARRQELTERLLAELINSETGDAAAIWRSQSSRPFGSLRDPARIETFPPATGVNNGPAPGDHRSTKI